MMLCSKYLPKRTISGKVLKDRAYEIELNSTYDGYQRELASMVYTLFYKKKGSGLNANDVLAQQLHKPVNKKFKSRKFYSRIKYNIWETDFVEMGSFSSCSWDVEYLLCAIDIFLRYARVKALTDKKAETSFDGFIGIVDKSKPELNKLRVDHSGEFNN